MHIEIKSSNQRVSKLLAMTAMTLLLVHLIDGSIERTYKHGFLPSSIVYLTLVYRLYE